MSATIQILVDADACPVKAEIYKVAIRHQAPVSVVSNSYMHVPESSLVKRIIVGAAFDAADDYIAERAGEKTVVITGDILLASRCIKAKATVVAPNGRLFTEDSIGTAVATRAIMEDLRAGGENHGGAQAFSKADRSRFLSALHDALVRLQRS